MKKYPVLVALLAMAPWALAVNPQLNQAELSDAQMRYQALLNAQTTDQSELMRLRSRLQQAQQRLMAAQLEVDRVRAELLLMQDIQQKNLGALKSAGTRLDKAWQAVYGR